MTMYWPQPKHLTHFTLGLCLLFSAQINAIEIIKRPVTFDHEREQLSLAYLKERHGIEKDKALIDPKMVVVHYTVVPTLEKTIKVFNSAKLPGRADLQSASALNVSSQFVIDRDGKIYQILPKETSFARHVIGLNYAAFGIENVGDNDKLPLTDKQLSANVALIKYLKEKYPSVEYLIGHQEYNLFRGHPLFKETNPNYRTEKSDPGVKFMDKLRAELTHLKLQGPPKQIK